MTYCHPLEFFTVIQGEDRSLALRILYADSTPFNLTGATEIRARFKKTDGQTLEKRLSEGGVTITDAFLGRVQVNLTAVDTQALFVAERMDFSVLVDKGARATSLDLLPYTFTALNPGTEGNSIALVFDGVKTISQVVTAWNNANPLNRVNFTGGDGSDVPSSQTLTLAGGTSNRRKVNFKRGITVERQAQ